MGGQGSQRRRLYYGGQAVLEGVMIRGRRHMFVACRRPDGTIATYCQRLRGLYSGTLREVPLVRGVLVLIETLSLGMKALAFSSNVALGEEEKEGGGGIAWVTLSLTLLVAAVAFFVGPVLLARWLDDVVGSGTLVNIIEGLIRVGLFVGYVWAIGFLPDIRRVFAYHGAEHKAIHAYEARAPLTVASVQRFSAAHPRCGTSFLLVVGVVAIVVFVLLGTPVLWWRILSRVVFIPAIAAISYEAIRLGSAWDRHRLVRLLFTPNLALQAFTTRQPEDDQVEVAINALEGLLAAEAVDVEGRPAAASVDTAS